MTAGLINAFCGIFVQKFKWSTCQLTSRHSLLKTAFVDSIQRSNFIGILLIHSIILCSNLKGDFVTGASMCLLIPMGQINGMPYLLTVLCWKIAVRSLSIDFIFAIGCLCGSKSWWDQLCGGRIAHFFLRRWCRFKTNRLRTPGFHCFRAFVRGYGWVKKLAPVVPWQSYFKYIRTKVYIKH
jgi:hypothetical protein